MKLGMVLLLLGAALPPLVAQQAAAPPERAGTQSWSISGVVLNAGGAPLSRAEVTLSSAEAQEDQAGEAVTGDTGEFRFNNLPPGKYRLDAWRRGYIGSAYQEHAGGYFTAIVTGPGLESQGLQFRLMPEAVIGGTVTDDSGEAVGGAQVTLYHEDHDDGSDHVAQVDSDASDDTGGYEFAHLKPGTYYLSVSATPWYAVPAQEGNEAGAGQQPHSALDVAYPTTFYVNATDSGSATPVAVNAGDHLQLNFSLHAVSAVHLRVRVPGDRRRGFTIPQVTENVFGSEQPVPLNGVSMIKGDSGALMADLGGLAPGTYVLRQFGPRGERGHTTVDATGSQTIESPVADAAGVDVTGKLEMASGAKAPHPAAITLAPAERGEAGGPLSAALEADGSFAIHGVPPGSYNVRIGTEGDPIAVLQMAASGAQTSGSRITVAGDPVLLAATLVSGSTTVSGYAQAGGKGFGGALILLVPTDTTSSRDLYRMDQSDSDGSFTLSRVFPGAYTLVAIDGGWGLDWSRREVIAPYLARGTKVQVTAQQALDLPAAVEVQSR